jgi:hypothetical protein
LTLPTPQEIKKAIVAAGLEVFRTRPDEVVLAERVRENLILDSGVRVRPGDPAADGSVEVRVVMKVQQADFPGEPDEALFNRARALGARASGFVEVGTHTDTVSDPGGSQRTLDVVYEVTFSKAEVDLDAAIATAKAIMGIERTASK